MGQRPVLPQERPGAPDHALGKGAAHRRGLRCETRGFLPSTSPLRGRPRRVLGNPEKPWASVAPQPMCTSAAF